MSVRDLQRRLLTLGFPLPRFGADGDFGGETQAAVNKALDEIERNRVATSKPTAPPAKKAALVIPADWMPDARMLRIIIHWTAGRHKASPDDKDHYHFLIEGAGVLIKGTPSVALNSGSVAKGYAAHTLNCNSGSIGVSLCCMAGATERPFHSGAYPMTRKQWDKMIEVVAELCRRYSIPVTNKTVLTHAEVQNNLGIQQRGKWDITRLSFAPEYVGARDCGDLLRSEVASKL